MDGLNEYSHNSFDLQSLLNSFPGDLEFKQIFNDIDEQMVQNAASIEHCIEEIQSEVNKLCPDVQLQTTSDCFKWLTSYNYNSSTSPSIPHGDLIKFLKIMKDLLNNEDNQEEMILDLLWDLSRQSSISFLSPLGGTSFCFLSRTSLHSVEDHSSVDVKSIWDDVRLHLRRFLVNRLESHNEINNSQQRIELKNQCMKQLLLLYPESEVLTKYQNLQKRLLAKFLQNSFPSCNRDLDLEVIAHRYQSTMPTLYSMIKEDFNILHEILAPSSMVQFIKETYLDTVTEEMAKILENFCELQFKENAIPGVKTSKSCSKHRGTFCSDIMEKLDTMLPLALACRDDSLQEIRGTLVEACCKVATAVLERLQERSREVPSGAPLKNLHIILSTAAYVSQHFTCYDNLMRETTKKPIFLVPVQRYQEFINTLQFQVTDYCVRVCATSILQDAESHHWDDYKAFYEGERCSFSIQMWHYFSWALRHDLWTILPAKLAQEILTAFLEKSLGLLASRYARACPSPKRTAQIRLDVTTILICTENILWSVCTSVQEVLNPHEYINNKIFKIHTHCNNLCTTLAILTSPLPEIYQPVSAGGLNAEGQLKLLLSQPCCKWSLLLETLLHGGGLIPRILLKSSSDAFMAVEESPGLEGDAALELTEQKTNVMILDLCHKPGGSEYLRQIYHIMRLNEEYLKEQLFAMDGSEEKPIPSQPLKVTLRNVEDQPAAFNPFHVHKMFSENMLGQATATWSWSWSQLLPNYLRLDTMTFAALLKNRTGPIPCDLEMQGRLMKRRSGPLLNQVIWCEHNIKFLSGTHT
ncbi:2210408I21Rik [Phodopus roborovskii]|uniref:2210408I21Rik protein n=1 Tax=Phodopus roborovskii TaxID=109678 RepID=A0AAU9Z6L5_PHORO|nr:2210408I21Rik [Phodopus roborovskii]